MLLFFVIFLFFLVNYKINEVNEDDISPQNESVRKTEFKKTEEFDEENNEKNQSKSIVKDTKNSRFSVSKHEKTEKSINVNDDNDHQGNKNEEMDMENMDNMDNIDEMDMENMDNNNEMEMENMDGNEDMEMENMDVNEDMEMENMDNNDEMAMEDMEEKNEEMDHIEEMDEEKNEEMDHNEDGEQSPNRDSISRKSKKSTSKILKTNSVVYDDNNNQNEDSLKNEQMDDLVMEEIEEIKDENANNHISNINKTTHTLKTNESKKKELTENSIRSKNATTNNNLNNKTNRTNLTNRTNRTMEEEMEKKSSSHYIAGGSGNNNNSTKNKINISQVTQSYQKESKSKKNETLNLNDDLNKINKNLYESVPDSSRNDKSVTLQKLTNIPAACELEEYYFLFIDLEEFIHFHSNGFNLFELAEFMKRITNENKKPRIVLNYPNILINLNVVNLDILQILMDIMSYTDIFLFEKKECLAFFNMLSQMNYEKDLNDKQLNDYFFKEIPHFKIGTSKLGLFLDDMQKINIAEQKGGKIANEITYDIHLYPKINHFNQKIIEEYKKIIAVNNSYFKSIFFGGYFSSFVFNFDQFQSFKSGAESTKRILEIFKNKIDFPTNPEFYTIKLQKKKIEKDLHSEKLRKKEDKFVLDCINKTNSSIKCYNPLFDDNLNAFFANSIIRKQLKEKGFINTNGFVLYDSSYKGIVGVPPKQKKRLDTSERERHLLLAIKQNKVKI